MEENKESRLSITTSPDGSHSDDSIYGTNAQNLFNIAILFRDVSNELGIPPFVLGAILPDIISDLEKGGMGVRAIKVDTGAIKKGLGQL